MLFCFEHIHFSFHKEYNFSLYQFREKNPSFSYAMIQMIIHVYLMLHDLSNSHVTFKQGQSLL